MTKFQKINVSVTKVSSTAVAIFATNASFLIQYNMQYTPWNSALLLRQIAWFFGKNPRRGGMSFSIQNNYIAYFWPFKRTFFSEKKAIWFSENERGINDRFELFRKFILPAPPVPYGKSIFWNPSLILFHNCQGVMWWGCPDHIMETNGKP